MVRNGKREGKGGDTVPKLKILIVDDLQENRYLLETILGAQEFDTVSAANGIEALEHLKKQHFDAIISDLLMPKMDGFQLIRTCKKDPGLSNIPFIIYTATYTDTKDVEFGLSLGAARYIIKPAEPDVLLRELEETLGQVMEGTLEEAGPGIATNGMVDQEYVRRLVAKLDKKILDLEKSEEKYRAVFENTGTATVVLEQDNIISLANEEFAKLSGFTKNDIEGKKCWTEFVVKEDLERMLAQHRLRREYRKKALTHYEFRFVTKSGDIRDIYLTIDLIPGTTTSLASLLDITDAKRAEEALRKSEEKFRNVFDWTNDAVMLHTLTTTETPGRFIEVNKGACLMLGYTRDEMLRLGPSDIVPADQHPMLGEIIRQAAAKESVLFETRFMRKDGTTVPVESSGHLVTYGGQKIWISHVRDITGRKQAEEALRESEEKYRTLVQSAGTGIILQSASGEILTWNPAAERVFGISADEVLGHISTDRKWESVREDGSPYPAAEHPSMVTISTGKAVRNVVMGVTSSMGTFSWISINTTPLVRNGETAPYAVVITFQDITARKQAEVALRESEEKYRLIADNTTDTIWIFDLDLHLTYMSPSVKKMRGFTVEEAIAQSLDQMMTPASAAVVLKQFHEEMEKEARGTEDPDRTVMFETDEYCKDGSIIRVENSARLLRDGDGHPYAVLGISRDITDRRRAEDALRESEVKYRLLAETSPEMIFFVDNDGYLRYLNQTAARQFDTTPDQLTEKHLSEIFPPQTAQNHLEAIRKVAAERRVLRRELVEEFPSGTVYIEVYLTPVVNSQDQVTGVLGLSNDITQRKKTEVALQQANAYNRSLIEASLDPLVTISHDGKIQDVNSATELATGLTRNELIGTDFSAYFAEPEKARQGYLSVFSEGHVIDYPLEIRHRAGHTVPVLYNATVYRDPDGNVRGVFAAARDITQRKKAEEQREILIRELAQKNTELDRFTYTVSHDLKSPLVGIRAFLTLLEDDLKAGNTAQAETDIRRIDESSEKLELLITTLLTLSRSGRTVDIPVTIPFSELAREAAQMLWTSQKESGITLVIPDNLPEVSGDRQRLLQVMTNLLDNAVKFMGGQKDPRIEVGARNEAGILNFFVKDNGMGIDPANQPKLFGLYERFNPDIPGTGIGLASVKRIIEAHGGRIWAESEGRGKGTTVCFTLPSGDGKPEKRG